MILPDLRGRTIAGLDDMGATCRIEIDLRVFWDAGHRAWCNWRR